MTTLAHWALDYPSTTLGRALLVHADCIAWLGRIEHESIHAIVTDPPYGVKEYNPDQIEKRTHGKGGIWRIPPAFDGSIRAPLPRFTALNSKERELMRCFFTEWGELALKALVPGGHLFIATNAFLSQLVFSALVASGWEFRGELIRLVRTFRGGDRPKNAEEEFSEVCSLPRSAYEPWGIFRKPLPKGMKLSDCLRVYGTGGLRRISPDQPFTDVILSERTSRTERQIADHPSLKPQSFLRRVVHAALPLGTGVLLDPFMGSGSTIAAAESLGYSSIGVERIGTYYDLSIQAIPKLVHVAEDHWSEQLSLDTMLS
ncbi:MAG: site-specific DNA-methyltransferase [Candidatus Viridilinea halotolerans]|uniref:Methyltransferase n=1 Tax=Candidatus Viridilinea halotolerans TaxID=2491704 RepID=A0A426TQE0_9CHLR|nr:MAG: site-specific DNA-methyltransferase [Candidatus Viridilinea halotolerans]